MNQFVRIPRHAYAELLDAADRAIPALDATRDSHNRTLADDLARAAIDARSEAVGVVIERTPAA